MTRLTATVSMLVCCAGAAFAQTEGKSCCPAEKAEAIVQTVAQEGKAKDCSLACPAEGTAQTVAQEGKAKDCSLACPVEATAQTVAAKEAKAGCCPITGAAQEVAFAVSSDCKTACSDKVADCKTACSDGKVALLAADMPVMQRKVGRELVNCPAKASELASASGEPVIFLVGQQSFKDQASATRAYATALTSYLDTATRVTFAVDGECVPCPEAASKACGEGKAMKYRVAGRDFDSAEAAVRAAAMAYAASRQVNMKYAVNGECAGSCDKSAKAKSMATAQPVVYRVGDKETRCDVQASVMLVIARIEAAATAVQAMPQS